MQRAAAGKTDLVDARADRGFDILAFSGSRITLPLAPFRNHHRPSQLQESCNTFYQIDRSGALHLRRNLNALSQQLFQQCVTPAGYAD
jgi:hypothetical protein